MHYGHDKQTNSIFKFVIAVCIFGNFIMEERGGINFLKFKAGGSINFLKFKGGGGLEKIEASKIFPKQGF